MQGSPILSNRMWLIDSARRSKQLLDSEAVEHLGSFVRGSLNPDGGFRDRSGASDLYYTLFGLQCLVALERPLPADRVGPYLDGFGDGEDLDLVHLTCLARSLVRLPRTRERSRALAGVLDRLDALRAPAGGFMMQPEARQASIYATFLAALTFAECGIPMDEARGLLGCLEPLRCGDGSYADQPGLATGTTTVTAAACLLFAALAGEVPPEASQWLGERHSSTGGYHANPSAPVADLLSTAAAMLALEASGQALDATCAADLQYIETLWEASGGFCGHLFDDETDCEYTFYGLLGLGVMAGAGAGVQ